MQGKLIEGAVIAQVLSRRSSSDAKKEETWRLGPSIAVGEGSQYENQQQIFPVSELVDDVLQHSLCQPLHEKRPVATAISIIKRAVEIEGQQYLRLRARRNELLEKPF